MNIKGFVINVTPELAERLLTKNNRNRTLSRKNLAYLKKEILRGNWKLSGEPILFDTNGSLINGQHRLSAVIEADKAVTMLIITGIEPEAFSVLDTGKNRNGSDTLHIQGYANASILSHTIKKIELIRAGCYGIKESKNLKETLSNEELDVWVKANPSIEPIVSVVGSLFKKIQGQVPQSVIAGLYFLFNEKSPEHAKHFIDSMCTGAGLSMKSPIMALRNRLNKSATSKKKSDILKQPEIINLIIHAWNLYLANKRISVIESPVETVEIKNVEKK